MASREGLPPAEAGKIPIGVQTDLTGESPAVGYGLVDSSEFGGEPVTLAGLTDVDISSPADGQGLVFNATSGKWEPLDLAGSGGAAPEVKDLAGIFTEAAGFTVVDSGGFYIDGNHLVVLWAKIIHAASLAVVAEQTVVAGSFVGEVAPLAFGYEVTPAWVYSGGFKAAEVSVDANLTFMAYASASAAADVQFGLYNTRWPLADPDAARAFVAAL